MNETIYKSHNAINLSVFRLSLFPKKRKSVSRRKRTSKRVNIAKTKFRTFNDGYKLGDKLVKAWNSQPNPPPVYIAGNRIHHGLVGVLLGLAGIVIEQPALIGLGTRLAIDDISDMPNWLNFENSSTQPQFQTGYVQPMQYLPTSFPSLGQRNEFV